MSIILVFIAALVVGLLVQQRWVLLLPVAVGASVAAVIALSGHGLSDTPIPFLVVASTLMMIGGRGLAWRGRGDLR